MHEGCECKERSGNNARTVVECILGLSCLTILIKYYGNGNELLSYEWQIDQFYQSAALQQYHLKILIIFHLQKLQVIWYILFISPKKKQLEYSGHKNKVVIMYIFMPLTFHKYSYWNRTLVSQQAWIFYYGLVNLRDFHSLLLLRDHPVFFLFRVKPVSLQFMCHDLNKLIVGYNMRMLVYVKLFYVKRALFLREGFHCD